MVKYKTREDAVAEFNKAADFKTFSEGGSIMSHASCFAEEVGELGEAISLYMDDPNEETRQDLVKEWADVQVVLSNLAWFFEIDGQVAFNIVHASNMSKLIDGEINRREDGKVLKGDGYTPPDMRYL